MRIIQLMVSVVIIWSVIVGTWVTATIGVVFVV